MAGICHPTTHSLANWGTIQHASVRAQLMATQTFPYASFGPDVRCELDVNDKTWRPSQVRVINNSASPLKARVLEAGAVVFEATAPAGQTTSWNISGVQLGWDSVNGGLMLGDYVLQAQWPAG